MTGLDVAMLVEVLLSLQRDVPLDAVSSQTALTL